MTGIVDGFMQQQLLERRQRLERALSQSDDPAYLHRLFHEVDEALARIDCGSYGICEHCHEAIETDRLIADPLTRFCLDHLNERQKSALEQDLHLAAQIQRGLLPRPDLVRSGWHISYHYEPAGVVSGDYCDVVETGAGDVYFMLGDVSGKGVAASMLMAHLHAMFRSLISVGLPLKDMMERASRVFYESVLPTQYATLVCGKARPDGGVELSNAGHVLPLVVCGSEVTTVEASGLPLGMFGDEEFPVSELTLAPGEGIVLYSDGISEATDASGAEYGSERLRGLIGSKCVLNPMELIAACRNDLNSFRWNAPLGDDVTMLAIGRAAPRN